KRCINNRIRSISALNSENLTAGNSLTSIATSRLTIVNSTTVHSLSTTLSSAPPTTSKTLKRTQKPKWYSIERVIRAIDGPHEYPSPLRYRQKFGKSTASGEEHCFGRVQLT